MRAARRGDRHQPVRHAVARRLIPAVSAMRHGHYPRRFQATAWPTLALGVSCAMLWGLSFWAGSVRALPAGVCLGGASVLAYVSYIAMHDAAHGGVSRRRWVNGAIGRLCLLPLSPLLSFPAFRYLHVLHH